LKVLGAPMVGLCRRQIWYISVHLTLKIEGCEKTDRRLNICWITISDALPNCTEIWYVGCIMGLVIKPIMTVGRSDLKWQYSANCHLLKFITFSYNAYSILGSSYGAKRCHVANVTRTLWYFIVLLQPTGGSETQSVQNYEIGCQLLLITNRKSHTDFRLIPTSMALNDLKRNNSPYLRFFHRIRLLYWPITSQWLKIDL